MSEQCSGHCETCKHKAEHENTEQCQIDHCLSQIGRKLVVMSGKGGVGKSTVAVNLAYELVRSGKKVGLLDLDFHGPSIPVMLNLEGQQLESDGEFLYPAEKDGLKVMSIGFLLENTDSPVVWRGPVKMGFINQMFTNVKWGELDFLIVDCPPGTGDEPLSICQMLNGKGGEALIVTTPQHVSASDVSKSISFCNQMKFPIAGLVENMSGFVCPHCGEVTYIFSQGAGEELALVYGMKFLGRLPVDPTVCVCGDDGNPFVSRENSPVAEEFRKIVAALV